MFGHLNSVTREKHRKEVLQQHCINMETFYLAKRWEKSVRYTKYFEFMRAQQHILRIHIHFFRSLLKWFWEQMSSRKTQGLECPEQDCVLKLCRDPTAATIYLFINLFYHIIVDLARFFQCNKKEETNPTDFLESVVPKSLLISLLKR